MPHTKWLLDLISQAVAPLTTPQLLVSSFTSNLCTILLSKSHPSQPTLPPINATNFVANFTGKFRSLANAKFPVNVPQKVDRNFFFTVGLGTSPCPKNTTCQGPSNNTKFAASVNNISFALPSSVSIMQAYYSGQTNMVFKTDFPATPLNPFNYTGTPPNNTMVTNDTKLVVLKFNTSVEVVLQDTNILGAESHPLHLHGYDFFIVGQGFGNYDPTMTLQV
ncbi:hypothetical protein PHAVU_008G119201 [Phaseolus vulgaris]